MPLGPGDKLGPYEILALLGTGGMGEVWKARDTRLNRTVALKISKVEFSDRFEREARAVAALNHPHICTLHDVGPDYLVMEFVDGEPLKGPLPLPRAAEYALQILDALDAAHKRGVIHRDLKPANILVTKQGVKLLDFGLAKQAGPVQESDATLTAALTGKGTILGTLQYMAPEQLQGQEADARSDLFAFGCVLYEMLSGKRAFDGASAASVIAAIMEREPAPLEIASPMERVIRKCLAKDPEERFQSARDLKTALHWSLEQVPAATPARPKRASWIGIAAVMAMLAGIGGWAIAHRGRTNEGAEIGVMRFKVLPPEKNYLHEARISPDGRTLAFMGAEPSGKSFVWVQNLDSLQPQRLAPADFFVFWSPDSRFIAFADDGKLKKIDRAGGPPQTICAAELVLGGTWSRDGIILYSGSTGGGPEIFQVSAGGGEPKAVTRLDPARGETQHVHPVFLPDGRHFLYTIQSAKVGNEGIFLGSMDAPGERVRLLEDISNADYAPDSAAEISSGHLLFVRGETLMAQRFDAASRRLKGDPFAVVQKVFRSSIDGVAGFSASRNGILAISSTAHGYQVTWFDRTGNRLGTIGSPGLSFYPQISPDERTLMVDVHDTPTFLPHVWLYPLGHGSAVRFTFGPSLRPVWSPDGSQVVFESMTSAFYTKSSAGTETESVLLEAANIPDGSRLPCAWEGGGRFLIYAQRDPKTGFDLWMLPLTGNRAPVSLLHTEFNEGCGAVSPDGHWMAYSSDEPGRNEIYVQPFSEKDGISGRKWQISYGGGRWPKWRRDGKELFYLSGDRKVVAVDVKLGSAFEAGTPKSLFATGIGNGDARFDATADGQRFVIPAPVQENDTQPAVVILNWQKAFQQ